MIVFAILVASAIFLDNVSGNGILYDGRSTFSKVELSQHIEFKDFTISVWFNMKRKVSHRHLPQCIFAKGNWISSKPRATTIALFVTSTSRLVLSLDLKQGKEIECELLGNPLMFSRWYHFAFDYSATGYLNVYLNGFPTSVSCTYQNTNRINIFDGDNFLMKRIGFVPTGSLKYSIASGEKFNMTIGSCSDSPQGLSADDFLFSGMISNFTLFLSTLDKTSVQHITKSWDIRSFIAPIFSEPPLEAFSSCDASGGGLVAESLRYKRIEQQAVDLNTIEELVSNWFVFGDSVSTVNPQYGDCVLSVMLSVAQAKVLSENDSTLASIGGLHDMTDDSPIVNKALAETLVRHFTIKDEEERLWTSLNKYSSRLEMLGHSVSLLLKQKSKTKSGQFNKTEKETSEGGIADTNSNHRPVIALITPATSRGTSPTALEQLPLLRALLPSIYATLSSGFDYKVYLVVNEHDSVYGDKKLVNLIFEMARATWLKTQRRDHFAEGDSIVQYEIVLVPDSMTPKYALSGLFNHGTLRAYHDDCDYFYLVNDDLLLISEGWTEIFVNSLLNSPYMPGLGVAGGVDVSDSITPQIEFPFFHRTHVEIFHWCGANPWTFSNWWEDNWLTDIYVSFRAVYYNAGVLLSNYVGVDRNIVQSEARLSSIGALDPRYEVEEGRRTPDFYSTEVERGRSLIMSYLQKKTGIASLNQINISYCHFPGGKMSTLAEMHLDYYEDPLDPCNSHLRHSDHDERRYQSSLHEQEMPHHSYAELIENFDKDTVPSQYYQETAYVSSECQSELSADNTNYNRNENKISTDLLKACAASVGITAQALSANRGYLINAPLSKGKLCDTTLQSEDYDNHVYESCSFHQPLNVLIVHNHCPLFTRYGSDKRLFHIAETLRGLGHNVHFGGMEVSGLETEDDHLRVKSIGARLYSPLVVRSESEIHVDPHKLDAMLDETRPDIVILTMWFWNVAPAAEMFLKPIRDAFEDCAIIVLSDDAHTLREAAIQDNKSGKSPANRIFSKVKVANVFRLEYTIYNDADAVLTITDTDTERILSAKNNPEHYQFLGITQDKFLIDRSKLKPVRYALSDSEISQTVSPFEQRSNCLVFVGNGANPTNIDALNWFFNEIFWPVLHKISPTEVKLKIIGADWDFILSVYPELYQYVEVLGLLRQGEVTDILHLCKVFISPITSMSTGLNTKNIFAISRGIPLVTTSTGADGLQWNRSELVDQSPFFIAASSTDFVHKVVELFHDKELWEATSRCALQHARKHFSLTAQAHDIEELIKTALDFAKRRKSEEIM